MLNVKQEAFCLHYATSGNATESYKEAGYACKNDAAAGASARRLLQQDKIKNRLAELAEEMASEKIANGLEIQERLTAILRGELKEDQVVVEGCGDGVSQATVVERNPQLKDVIRAAVELARMQGTYNSKMQVELTIPVFGGEEDLED